MAGFGAQFRPQGTSAVTAGATPTSGNGAEVIWHQLFDTQLFTQGTTTQQNFFLSPNGDPTLTNMTQAGTLPSPQTLQIYNVCVDVLSILPVSTNAASTTTAGVLNDLALLIFGYNQRPVWTLGISGKNYGPYSLTVLHGTGGPIGFGWGAEVTSIQYARNDPSEGWNYYGRVTILQQMNFSVQVQWAATATLTENKYVRMSFFGVLNRRVL